MSDELGCPVDQNMPMPVASQADVYSTARRNADNMRHDVALVAMIVRDCDRCSVSAGMSAVFLFYCGRDSRQRTSAIKAFPSAFSARRQ
jgi:hypothetical protein